MISNLLLRQATEEFHEETMSAIPAESECDHIFSERFETNMESVIPMNRHPQRNHFLRLAASFALVLFFAGGSLLTLSPTARATIVGWLWGQEGDAYTYRSTGNDTASDTLTTYDFAYIPEGYTLRETMLMPNSGLVIYCEEGTGRLLKIFYAPNDGSGALYLIPEDATLIPIQLGNVSADYYQSNSEDASSTIVWTDPENDYLVCVDGFFSQEALTDMALHLVKTDVPKPEYSGK